MFLASEADVAATETTRSGTNNSLTHDNKPGVRVCEDFRQKLENTKRVGNMTEHVR